MKPQLAKDAPTDKDGNLKIQFPAAVQPKYDGIRCAIVDGKALTRSLKEIPNREIFEYLSRPEFEGLDGEIIVGDPTAEGGFNRTTSYVMTPTKKTGENWAYYVFDKWNEPGGFWNRFGAAREAIFPHGEKPLSHGRLCIVPSENVLDLTSLEAFEAKMVANGWEGVIVRNPDLPYKFGRSGTKTGEALKIKRFKDGEAIVLDVYERLHNANEATTNALGRTERSSHKAGKIGRGDLGGFMVEEVIDGQRTGRCFKVGTGFNDEQRAEFWDDNAVIGRIVKFKHFEVGSKDLPRFPVFLGFRDERDMS